MKLLCILNGETVVIVALINFVTFFLLFLLFFVDIFVNIVVIVFVIVIYLERRGSTRPRERQLGCRGRWRGGRP